jgi:hypothetical protein
LQSTQQKTFLNYDQVIPQSCAGVNHNITKNVVSQPKEKLTFNVVKENVNISISHSYNCLYQSLPHPISIKTNDSSGNYIKRLAGVTINETDSGTFLVPQASKEALLTVYEVKNGIEKLIMTKKYLVLPEPKLQIRNKPTDNFLMNILLVSGTLKGITQLGQKKIVLKVTSFKVLYTDINGEPRSDSVIGNTVPITTRKEIAKLSDGALIYYENIVLQITPDFETELQPYRITSEVVDPKTTTKFGL